jgi:hypothetical protein
MPSSYIIKGEINMEQIKNRYGLAIEPGVLVEIVNGECHTLGYIGSWENGITGTTDYYYVAVCWLCAEQKKLKKRLTAIGSFAEHKSDYSQAFAKEPMTQEQFDDELVYADTVITMRQFIEGLPNLKDGRYFIRRRDNSGKEKVEQSKSANTEVPAPSAPSTPSQSAYLTIDQILDIISGLAESQGFYGRVLRSILEQKEEDPKGYAEWCKNVEGMNFTDTLEIVLYLEEGVLPKNFVPKKPEAATVDAATKTEDAKYPGVGRCTQKILDLVDAKTGAGVKRIAKHQLEKYGNDDIFNISIQDDEVTVSIGENWITFFFDPHQTTINDATGYGQGCRYHELMGNIATQARRAQLEGRL